jgi:hypothetical protein
MPGDILPFALDESPAPADIASALDDLLGERFEHGGKEYVLVKCEDAITAPGGYCFAWGATTDAAGHIVSLPGTSPGATIVGVISNDRGIGAIAADDYVLLQTKGRAELLSDSTTIAIGDYLTNGTATDGHVGDSGTTIADTDFARAVDTQGTIDTAFTAELLGPLPRS